MKNCTEGRICAWKCIQSIKVHDCLPSYRYSEFYNNPIIWFRITIGMSSTPVQEVLISTLPPPSLLFCLSSAVSPAGPTLQERRYYLSHKNFPSRPTWWRLPPPSCWPASPEWASSSWCSPTSSRGSAPCEHQMINVKRTKCNILTWPDRMD